MPSIPTPNAERPHIGLFGRTNTGKSSLINALTNQKLAVVSPVAGTTTDAVAKAMELLPLGPIVLLDTPGLDDKSVLGNLREEKTKEAIRRADLAILVAEAQTPLQETELALLEELKKREIPTLIAFNKCDAPNAKTLAELKANLNLPALLVSAKTGEGLQELKATLAKIAPQSEAHPLVRDLLNPNDFVVLVVPIDKAAPKGRLILPQQQVIRDALEAGAVPIVTRDTELAETLKRLPNPKLVITDSQAFGKVSQIVPHTLPLTSFSILLARAKGNLSQQIKGVNALLNLKDGEKILIAEGCTHHRQCEDIGTVKIPNWIKEKLHVTPAFSFTNGGEFPLDLTPYKVILHCGGCMLTQKEMQNRLRDALAQNVPITNYGLAIAALHGILKRSLEIFPTVRALLD